MDNQILKKEQDYTNPSGSTNTITSASLNNNTPPIILPGGNMDSSTSDFVSATGVQNKSEIEKQAEAAKIARESSISGISKLMSDIGAVESKSSKYENEAGVNNIQKQVDDIQSSIEMETNRIGNYIDNVYKNPNLTQTLASRTINEEQRKSASYLADLSIAKNVLSQDYDRAISVAKKKVEIELAPLQAELGAKKFVLENNKDLWTEAEKGLINNVIKQDERAYAEEKQNKQTIEEIKITAAKNGLKDMGVFDGVTTVDEALQAAGQYSTDPLERELKRLQIQKARNDLAPSGEDVPTIKSINGVDSQWDPGSRTWIPATVGGGGTQNESQRLALQDKTALIDTLLNSKAGLAVAVGANSLTRNRRDVTGRKQDFIAGVEQLVSQDTLDTLLELKKAGGTLGALSEGEGRMLKSAATKIGTWTITDKSGKVTGYNASESSFKKELETIKTLTNRALEEAGGTVDNNEQYLDTIDSALQVTNDPYLQAGYKL